MVFEQQVIKRLPEEIQSASTKKLQAETSELRALQFTGHERMLNRINSTIMTQQLGLNRQKGMQDTALDLPFSEA